MTPNVLKSEAEIDSFYNNYSLSFPDKTYYRTTTDHTNGHTILGGGGWYVEGYKTSSDYEWQIIKKYATVLNLAAGIIIYARSKNAGTWTECVAK